MVSLRMVETLNKALQRTADCCYAPEQWSTAQRTSWPRKVQDKRYGFASSSAWHYAARHSSCPYSHGVLIISLRTSSCRPSLTVPIASAVSKWIINISTEMKKRTGTEFAGSVCTEWPTLRLIRTKYTNMIGLLTLWRLTTHIGVVTHR